jgi:alpha-galactosidase/6-phospho-beta-glucosidase family protein
MIRKYRRVVIVGGGSYLWTPDHVGKMACSSSLDQAEVVLYDIDVPRAARVAALCNAMVARAYPDKGLRVSAAATLDEALPGAEAVFTTYCNLGIGVEHRLNAFAQRHGSAQNCYTAGPGAVLFIAIQAPVMVGVVQAMQRHCPQAWLINCANPLPAMGMVAVHAGADPRRVLGFCGALHWYRRTLADFLLVAPERLHIRIGGTNHCTFLTDITLDGQDAYPLVRTRARELGYLDLGCWGRSTTEIHLLEATGYLCPGGHPSDIFPTVHGEWMPPGPDAPPRPANFGQDFVALLEAYTRGEETPWTPPHEREVPVTWLDALAGDASDSVHSINYMNQGAVTNLPPWAVPDLECVLDPRGVSPVIGPPLPELIAEVTCRHQVVFDLAARAAVTRNHAMLRRAIQLDPCNDYLLTAERLLTEARAEFGEEWIF